LEFSKSKIFALYSLFRVPFVPSLPFPAWFFLIACQRGSHLVRDSRLWHHLQAIAKATPSPSNWAFFPNAWRLV